MFRRKKRENQKANADGWKAMVYFGKQRRPGVMREPTKTVVSGGCTDLTPNQNSWTSV